MQEVGDHGGTGHRKSCVLHVSTKDTVDALWYAEAFTVLQRCVGSHVCAQVHCHLCAQVPPSGGLKAFQQRYKIQPFSCPQLVGLVALVCPVVTRTVPAGAQC